MNFLYFIYFILSVNRAQVKRIMINFVFLVLAVVFYKVMHFAKSLMSFSIVFFQFKILPYGHSGGRLQ